MLPELHGLLGGKALHGTSYRTIIKASREMSSLGPRAMFAFPTWCIYAQHFWTDSPLQVPLTQRLRKRQTIQHKADPELIGSPMSMSSVKLLDLSSSASLWRHASDLRGLSGGCVCEGGKQKDESQSLFRNHRMSAGTVRT